MHEYYQSMLDGIDNSVMVFYAPVDDATLKITSIQHHSTEFKSFPFTLQYGNQQ